MKTILSLLASLGLCVTADSAQMQKLKCRVTFYSPCTKYGSKVADPKVKRAVTGVTAAAHPHFKFGTRIFVPDLKGIVGDGRFIVQDRGSAVTSKKASNGKTYVFDIFVTSRALVNKYKKLQPYMDVYILQ